jgi:hypothetical protein
MLFRGISWIHCICICIRNIGQVEITPKTPTPREQSFRYTLNIPPLKHPVSLGGIPGAVNHDSTVNCWCIYRDWDYLIPVEFRGYPLFHLGLLIEVALDIPITNISLKRPGLVKAKYLKLKWTSQGHDSDSEAESEQNLR